MNASLKANLKQYEQDEAERVWVDDSAEQLMMGMDITFKRENRLKQGMTHEQFAAAVDEFAIAQLSASGVSKSVLGRLVLAAKRRATSDACTAAAELLNCSNPDEALRQIAIKLLMPLAKDALIAQAEDAI